METLLGALEAALGPRGVLTGADAKARAVSGWSRLGTPRAVVRPSSTSEVAQALRLAHAAGAPVVPWGGLTGLVDGTWADGGLALSLDRMAEVEAIDRAGSTITVQAGCVLQKACEAAEAEDLFLPLDLGARGSATIGGVISTNAGGNRVLRFGMMREMVLGLEAVLADGTVVPAMNRLIKNNTGYDLKQLFIGSEGTLGVVTRAVLRLRPRPNSQDVAMLAVDRFDNLPRLLRLLEAELGGGLSAFEVMWPEFYQAVTTPPAAGRPVLPAGHAFYVLVEALGADPASDLERFERALGQALEQDFATDAALAKSQAERNRIWALRDDIKQTGLGRPVFTFDVSLPITEMECYVAEVRTALGARWPQAKHFVFGHLGDGNLHLVIGVGDHDARPAVEDIVYGPLQPRGGSVSAEHGIGLQKRDHLPMSRTPAELAVMRTLKTALDPKNILNPGKILPAA